MIEVEMRCFVDEAQYESLKKKLSAEGALLEDTRQVTHYLEHPVDTRIQFSREGGRVWQKMGKMHDNARKEVEVKTTREDAQKHYEIFKNLGFGLKVSWYRHRLAFAVEDVTVTLDNTIGYGRILEVEILSTETDTKKNEEKLMRFLEARGLAPSSKDHFDGAFKDYVANWKDKTKHVGENWVDDK